MGISRRRARHDLIPSRRSLGKGANRAELAAIIGGSASKAPATKSGKNGGGIFKKVKRQVKKTAGGRIPSARTAEQIIPMKEAVRKEF